MKAKSKSFLLTQNEQGVSTLYTNSDEGQVAYMRSMTAEEEKKFNEIEKKFNEELKRTI